MSIDRNGLRRIKTIGALLDNRTRTPAGALLELSSMANEKQLLTNELDRWTRRHAEITLRLIQIAEKEARLLDAANLAPTEAPVAVSTRADKQIEPRKGKIRAQELSY